MLYAHREQMERALGLCVSMFMAQCKYKPEDTLKSDVTPLTVEFASGIN